MTTTPEAPDVVDALQRFAVLPDWLSAVMRPQRLEASLRRWVPELADGRLQLVESVTDRLRAKDEDWLVRCRVRVAEPGAAAREVVLVGTLTAPARRVPGPGAAPPGGVVPFGSPGWHGDLDDLGLHLRVQDSDEGLPALAALLDPQAAAGLIQRCLRAGARPDATVEACTPRVVRYKPGSRCTIVYRVRYAGTPADLPDPVVAKTHQGDKGLVAHRAMRALWATPLAAGDRVALAEPLGFLPGERVLLQGPVPEDRTLKELARQALTDPGAGGLGDLRAELTKTAAALAALHASGALLDRTVAWGDELVEVRGVLDRLSSTVPGLRDAAEPLLARLELLDAAVPADPVVSAHHDFRPAQVLLHAGRVGFIDFDGAAMAEPALDIGRFRGKLRDIGVSAPGAPLTGRSLEDRLGLLDDLCEHFLAAYQRHAAVSRERVLLWETTDLLTALLHTWTKVRLYRVAPRLAVLVHQLRPGDGGVPGAA